MEVNEIRDACVWLTQQGFLAPEQIEDATRLCMRHTNTIETPYQLMLGLQTKGFIASADAAYNAYSRGNQAAVPFATEALGPGNTAVDSSGAETLADSGSDGEWIRPDGVPESLGHYEVRGLLGRGAMGLVLHGRDPKLERRVAIKQILPGGGNEESIARFRVEAKMMAAMTHQNVVAVHELGEYEILDFETKVTLPYIVMQFIDGKTLTRAVEGLDVHQRLDMFRDVVQGVAAMHAKGLVHQDLKPENIMVEASSGRPVVMDLGLAWPAETFKKDPDQVEGTPVMMAPEQLTVTLLKPIAQSDVYSLAKILVWMLTGTVLHQGPTITATFIEVREEPKTNNALKSAVSLLINAGHHKELIELVTYWLNSDHNARTPNAGVMLKQLNKFLADREDEKVREDERLRVMQERRAEDAERLAEDAERLAQDERARANRFLWGLGAVAAIAILLAITAAFVQMARRAAEAREAEAVLREQAEAELRVKAESLQQETELRRQEADARAQAEAESRRLAELRQAEAELSAHLETEMVRARAMMDVRNFTGAEAVLTPLLRRKADYRPALWALGETQFYNTDEQCVAKFCEVAAFLSGTTDEALLDERARAQFMAAFSWRTVTRNANSPPAQLAEVMNEGVSHPTYGPLARTFYTNQVDLNALARIDDSQQDPFVRYALGVVHKNLGNAAQNQANVRRRNGQTVQADQLMERASASYITALVHFQSAHRLNPHLVLAFMEEGQIRMFFARLYREGGKLNESEVEYRLALENIRQSLVRIPNWAWAYVNEIKCHLGLARICLERGGEMEQGIILINRVVATMATRETWVRGNPSRSILALLVLEGEVLSTRLHRAWQAQATTQGDRRQAREYRLGAQQAWEEAMRLYGQFNLNAANSSLREQLQGLRRELGKRPE